LPVGSICLLVLKKVSNIFGCSLNANLIGIWISLHVICISGAVNVKHSGAFVRKTYISQSKNTLFFSKFTSLIGRAVCRNLTVRVLISWSIQGITNGTNEACFSVPQTSTSTEHF
jgi:hypothetical protein